MPRYLSQVCPIAFSLLATALCIGCGQSRVQPSASERNGAANRVIPHEFTTAEVAGLLNGPNVANLLLADGDLGDVEWDMVRAPSSLKSVTFKRIRLDEVTASWIARQPSVHRIRLTDCTHFDAVLECEPLQRKIPILVLEEMCLNDQDMGLVARFSNLHSLGLEGSHVSDEQVLGISKMQSLQVLSIHNTPVTGDAMRKIRERRGSLILDADEWKISQ